jgi:hypothetical protein
LKNAKKPNDKKIYKQARYIQRWKNMPIQMY